MVNRDRTLRDVYLGIHNIADDRNYIKCCSL